MLPTAVLLCGGDGAKRLPFRRVHRLPTFPATARDPPTAHIMFLYSVFGGVLRTSMEFPELQPSAGTPTWTLEVGDVPPSLSGDPAIGDDSVYGNVRVACYRNVGGHSLVYDDTGRFDISDGGALITWYRPAEDPPHLLDAVRADVIGRVLALALHQQGVLCLHASAVSLGGSGIALMAPKGHGKSTLATALVRAGGRLLSDDTVPVSAGVRVELRPGVPQLRLRHDAALHLAAERATEASGARKLIIDKLDPLQVADQPVPFVGGYVLVPALPNDEKPPVDRVPLSQVQATLALVEHTKLGPLLGGVDAARVFEQAATVAATVPLYLLRVGRDLSRIAEVAETIVDWHATRAA